MGQHRRMARSSGPRGGLCLGRRDQESIVLDLPHGERIVVTVYRCEWGKCHVRVDAPREVHVNRAELVNQGDAVLKSADAGV